MNYKMSDFSISQIVRLIQMGILTGTDVSDQLRTFELCVNSEGNLDPSPEFIDNFQNNITKLEKQALEEQAETYRDLLDSDDEADKPEAEATDTLLDKLQQDLSRVTTILAKLTTKSRSWGIEGGKASEPNIPSSMKL